MDNSLLLDKMPYMDEQLAALARYVIEARRERGLTQTDVVVRGGVGAGTIGMLEAGTMAAMPKFATLRKIAKGLGVPEIDVFLAAGLPVNRVNPAQLTMFEGSAATARLPVPEGEVPKPYGGEVGCGGRVELDPTATISVPKSLEGKGDFVLTARGSSMTKAGIRDGDLLFVRKQRKATHNQVVLAQIADEGATVKRFKISNPKVNPKGWLVAESHTEEHEPVPMDSSVHILGVVTYVQPQGFSLEDA